MDSCFGLVMSHHSDIAEICRACPWLPDICPGDMVVRMRMGKAATPRD